MELTTDFIQPIQEWKSIADLGTLKTESTQTGEPSLFRSVLQNAIEQVRTTQEDADNKKYLLATGQLDDAHSLPIAEAKATLSVDVLIGLRNKAMEAYNELMKISV